MLRNTTIIQRQMPLKSSTEMMKNITLSNTFALMNPIVKPSASVLYVVRRSDRGFCSIYNKTCATIPAVNH